MPRKFNPQGADAPPFYSHGVEVEASARMIFVSGQVGVRPDGSVAGDIGGQTAAAIDNVKSVLADAGMDVSDIVKLTIYLTDESSFDGFVAAAGPLLSQPPAAATMLYVKGLASPALLVEIEAVAAR